MKKLLIVLVALFAVFLLSVSGVDAACNSGSDEFTITSWCVDDSGTLTPQAGAGLAGIVEVYDTPTTATNTLTAVETGVTIVDTGSIPITQLSLGTTIGTGSTHVLPRAASGLTFTLTTGSKCNVTLDTVDTSDVIVKGFGAALGLDAGDSLKSSGDSGEYITVISPAANIWVITGMSSGWGDNGTN